MITTFYRSKTTWLLSFLVLIIIITSCSEKTQETSKPNIIFIMSDDHAFQAISAYDSTLIQTPNIDRMADEGIRFDRAFVTNSICSPSRAVILTGKFSHINGLRDNIQVFDSTQQTFPKLLRGAGYQTGIVGKWHLKSQPTGFDYWKVLPGQGHYYNPDFKTPEGNVREEGYVTDLITDFTIDWLENKRDREKPFMLMVHHKAPHREWLPAQRHLTSLRDVQYDQPATLFDNYSDRGRAAREAEMRIFDHMGLTNDSKIHPEKAGAAGYTDFLSWYSRAYHNNLDRMNEDQRSDWENTYGPINNEFAENRFDDEQLTSWKYQRYMEDYLGSIRSVDEGVGKIMDYLDRSGLSKNTLIVYTSDQGFYLGEHGWFDKRFMYEESFRTPLLMKWPGVIKEGTTNQDLVQNLDFGSTFLDAAGVPIPGDLQGTSLMPLLSYGSGETDWRDAIYYHYYEYPGIHAVKRHYGIRTDRYKLIHFYHDIDEWELYDLENDPMELRNIYSDPANTEIVRELELRLRQLQEQYGDSDALAQSILEEDLNR